LTGPFEDFGLGLEGALGGFGGLGFEFFLEALAVGPAGVVGRAGTELEGAIFIGGAWGNFVSGIAFGALATAEVDMDSSRTGDTILFSTLFRWNIPLSPLLEGLGWILGAFRGTLSSNSVETRARGGGRGLRLNPKEDCN
jgi:hypothetical protein